jgi:serine/threonine/tyrosine-interacting protein
MTIPPPFFSTNPSSWPELVMPEALRPYSWTETSDYASPENNWEYADRRKAQPITPFIFLGPLSAAKDADFLRDNGMTMIVSLRQPNPYGHRIISATMKSAQTLGVHVEDFSVPSLQHLRTVLPRVVNLIGEHLVSAPTRYHRLGRVMVVCENGNGMSAAIVIAFLIVS